ncbi:hypothetical protein FJ417_31305 [Mesorhizobium sp. B3-1-7]|nr:hypothetical protein FJ417_31305 [Mesorhizobium sp. B3-1-7]
MVVAIPNSGESSIPAIRSRAAKTCPPANPRAFHRFTETTNRSISLVLTQFPTENRVTLFLELL